MRYFKILAALDPASVIESLAQLADDGIAVLCCWEPPPPNPTWCDRAFVSAWLFDQLGLVVPELNHETLGHDWEHPNWLEQSYRRTRQVTSRCFN